MGCHLFNQDLQQVSIDELVELVTDCGVVIVDNPRLSNELKNRGFVMTEEHEKDGKIVLHKAEHEPEANDIMRTQSLVVDAYAPYSPKASLKPHPFAEDLARHGTPLPNQNPLQCGDLQFRQMLFIVVETYEWIQF